MRYVMPDVSSITDLDAKRPLLYAFAHQWLPALVHRRPREIRAQLAQDEARFVDAAWSAALSVFSKSGQQYPIVVTPTVAARRTVGERQWYAIAMPQPLSATEVFFIGLGLTDADASYMTLELGFDVAARAGALVLCSWTATGVHANWGAVELAIEPEPFLDLCVARQPA